MEIVETDMCTPLRHVGKWPNLNPPIPARERGRQITTGGDKTKVNDGGAASGQVMDRNPSHPLRSNARRGRSMAAGVLCTPGCRSHRCLSGAEGGEMHDYDFHNDTRFSRPPYITPGTLVRVLEGGVV